MKNITQEQLGVFTGSGIYIAYYPHGGKFLHLQKCSGLHFQKLLYFGERDAGFYFQDKLNAV